MSESFCFCVTVHLDQLFRDKRSRCKLFINSDQIKTVGEFLIKVRNVFEINDSIDLFVKDFQSFYYIPPSEDVRILQTNNVVVIKIQCDHDPKANCTSCTGDTIEKKFKKRKRSISPDNLSITKENVNDKVSKSKEKVLQSASIIKEAENHNNSISGLKGKVIRKKSKETKRKVLEHSAKKSNEINNEKHETMETDLAKEYKNPSTVKEDSISSQKKETMKRKVLEDSAKNSSKMNNEKFETMETDLVKLDNTVKEHTISSQKTKEDIQQSNTYKVHNPSFGYTAFHTEGLAYRRHAFKSRPEIKPMEISRVPKIIKSIKVVDSKICRNNIDDSDIAISTELYRKVSNNEINKNVSINSDLNEKNPSTTAPTNDFKSKNSLQEETTLNQRTSDLCLTPLKLENSPTSDSSAIVEDQKSPKLHSTPVQNGTIPNDDSVLNITIPDIELEESQNRTNESEIQKIQTEEIFAENFVMKRKRKRVRHRKKKSNNHNTTNNSLSVRDIRTSKPVYTKAAPLIHIKFGEDNDNELGKQDMTENELDILEQSTNNSLEILNLNKSEIDTTQNGESNLQNGIINKVANSETLKHNLKEMEEIQTDFAKSKMTLPASDENSEVKLSIKILANTKVCTLEPTNVNYHLINSNDSKAESITENHLEKISSETAINSMANKNNTKLSQPIEKHHSLNRNTNVDQTKRNQVIASASKDYEGRLKSKNDPKESDSSEENTSSISSDSAETINSEDSDDGINKGKQLSLSESVILKHPIMNTNPKRRDVIALKTMVLSENNTPEISKYFIAKVIEFNTLDRNVHLRVLEGINHLRGVCTLDENDDELKNNTEKLVCNWDRVFEPRLLFP